MEPTEGFWEGVAQSVGSSTGDWLVGVLGVVALSLIAARLALPMWRDFKTSQLDIERRRLELDAKAQEDSDARARDRIRLTERQQEVQASQTRAIETLTEQTAILNGQLEQSRAASAQMGRTVTDIGARVERIDSGVTELKDMVSRIGGAD